MPMHRLAWTPALDGFRQPGYRRELDPVRGIAPAQDLPDKGADIVLIVTLCKIRDVRFEQQLAWEKFESVEMRGCILYQTFSIQPENFVLTQVTRSAS